MILDSLQLREIYEGFIKPFGHPDPIGFVTRALLLSEGDDEYIGDGGKFGFMPMTIEQATEVGVTDVFGLQTNVTAALAIDRVNYENLGNSNDMIVAFHYPNDDITEHKEFIDQIDESRADTHRIMYPRLATRKDVIELLTESDVESDLTKEEKSFFDYLLTKG